jgi:hypothetical protein
MGDWGVTPTHPAPPPPQNKNLPLFTVLAPPYKRFMTTFVLCSLLLFVEGSHAIWKGNTQHKTCLYLEIFR